MLAFEWRPNSVGCNEVHLVRKGNERKIDESSGQTSVVSACLFRSMRVESSQFPTLLQKDQNVSDSGNRSSCDRRGDCLSSWTHKAASSLSWSIRRSYHSLPLHNSGNNQAIRSTEFYPIHSNNWFRDDSVLFGDSIVCLAILKDGSSADPALVH